MKILIVSDVYPPEPRGGARHTQRLAEHLSRRGHQVSVCTTAFPGFPGIVEENGLRVYRVHGLFSRIPFIYQDKQGRFPPPFKDWLLAKRLRRIIELERPDVVHAIGWMVWSLLPALKSSDVPLVLSLLDLRAICPASGMLPEAEGCDIRLRPHCVGCSRTLYGWGPLGLAKSLVAYLSTRANQSRFERVDRFVALSSHAKYIHMDRLGLLEHRFVVIPNFYELETYAEIESRYSLPQDFILFVGVLMPAKGVHVLLKAYRKLDTRTSLVLIGLKHHRYHYKAGEGIVLIENAPRDLILQAYDRCRFAVFPSAWPESSSTVILEAMASRKAVVCSDIGGLPELIVDGETGILVPPHDAEALSQTMRHLLQNPESAESMGQSGYKRWQQMFTPEVVTQEIEQLYGSLLKK